VTRLLFTFLEKVVDLFVKSDKVAKQWKLKVPRVGPVWFIVSSEVMVGWELGKTSPFCCVKQPQERPRIGYRRFWWGWCSIGMGWMDETKLKKRGLTRSMLCGNLFSRWKSRFGRAGVIASQLPRLKIQTNDIAAKISGAIVTRTKVLHIWNICPSLNWGQTDPMGL